MVSGYARDRERGVEGVMAEERQMSSSDHYRELDRAAEAVVKAPEQARGQAMSRLFALVRELASQEQKQRTPARR
jgi:hypothetical protein